MLELEALRASYGQIPALHDISLDVGPGEIVVLLGANGSGKTTTLRAICGSPLLSCDGGVRFDGKDVRGFRSEDLVRLGIAHVPEGRGTFGELTVKDNLRLGGYLRSSSDVHDDLNRWLEYFPRLGERTEQLAGHLSGGEQQMLAIARALMSRPKLLLLDEPSLGLAPLVVGELLNKLAELNSEEGMAILVVEQNAELALSIAQRGYIIQNGVTIATGSAEQLRASDEVRRAYLGE